MGGNCRRTTIKVFVVPKHYHQQQDGHCCVRCGKYCMTTSVGLFDDASGCDEELPIVYGERLCDKCVSDAINTWKQFLQGGRL